MSSNRVATCDQFHSGLVHVVCVSSKTITHFIPLGTLSTHGHMFFSTLPPTSLKPPTSMRKLQRGTHPVWRSYVVWCLGAHLIWCYLMLSGCLGTRVFDDKNYISLVFFDLNLQFLMFVYQKTLWGDVFFCETYLQNTMTHGFFCSGSTFSSTVSTFQVSESSSIAE